MGYHFQKDCRARPSTYRTVVFSKDGRRARPSLPTLPGTDGTIGRDGWEHCSLLLLGYCRFQKGRQCWFFLKNSLFSNSKTNNNLEIDNSTTQSLQLNRTKNSPRRAIHWANLYPHRYHESSPDYLSASIYGIVA